MQLLHDQGWQLQAIGAAVFGVVVAAAHYAYNNRDLLGKVAGMATGAHQAEAAETGADQHVNGLTPDQQRDSAVRTTTAGLLATHAAA